MLLVNHSRREFVDAGALMPDGADLFTNALTRYGPLSVLAALISTHRDDPVLLARAAASSAGAWHEAP